MGVPCIARQILNRWISGEVFSIFTPHPTAEFLYSIKFSKYLIKERMEGKLSLLERKNTVYGHTTLNSARSRLISEAKQGRAWLVLGWEKEKI